MVLQMLLDDDFQTKLKLPTPRKTCVHNTPAIHISSSSLLLSSPVPSKIGPYPYPLQYIKPNAENRAKFDLEMFENILDEDIDRTRSPVQEINFCKVSVPKQTRKSSILTTVNGNGRSSSSEIQRTKTKS